VALYDCYVFPVRPDDPDSIIAWQTLYWPAAAARGYIRANDPKESCIVWKDGAMINANELQSGKLKFGSEFSNVPPPGAINSVDYLITSHVVTSGSKYVFTLFLETAESREIVKTVDVEFSATVESANNAGKQAAMQMMPLFETIRKFEINKRNTDVHVAISDLGTKNTADEITIEPEKPSLDPGETIDVTLKMIDCDGVPLANRTLIFKDTTVQVSKETSELPLKGTKGGRVIPDVAVTDASGEVKVRFKAGNISGNAEIVAFYPHLKPCGRADAFMGTAILEINPHIYVEGSLAITLTDTVYSPQKKNHKDMTTGTIGFHSQITGQIIRSRVKRYIDDPATRLECDASTHCDVLGGSSYFIIYDKNKPGVRLAEMIYTIDVVQEGSGMGYRTVKGDEKYVQTSYGSSYGTNDVEGIQFEIKSYVAPKGQTQPAEPCYVIGLSGGKLMTKIFAHANGNGQGESWDYNIEGLAPSKGPFSIGIPYVIADPGHETEGSEIYDQLLIENYKEFDRFMLNPDGKTFTIKASGKRYRLDIGSQEVQRSIEVSLTFYAPEGGIDLAP
jgi:hypothetical protein